MNNYGNLIIELKNIRDEIDDININATANNVERAFDLCDAVEHINLAKHHLYVAINKLVVLNCFEKKEEKGNEKTD